ncbi:MAG: N-acetyl-alpha-D-glucosaminyl L-malate synthase BshA [Flavobacteriales bacterium]|nr:N-acetyl-alpha-D-glucosaminyl L-malate synthase BshA [Flavobacteriales bacterium]|tara:strand:- start:21483 stop:22631 length:1149 start_codon:yes stop_codon:yes gene_type:complete
MKDRLKIGIVCYPTYGGSGVIATELGIALSEKGHEIHFISYDQPFRLDLFSEKIYYHEVSVSEYPLFEYTPYELNLTSKLVDVALYEGLDILHVHYAIPHASSAVNAKQILATHNIHLPIVTTLHGTDITLLGKDKSFKPVIEYAINMSDAVTVVSENLKQVTLEYLRIKKEIVTIPNFIDMSLYQKKSDKNLRKNLAGEKEFIITHISNFRKVKRVKDVIKIFNKVCQNKSVKLLMIGDGPERIKAEQLSRVYGIEEQVRFLGKLRVIENILAISDIFFLPSETESFGLVALEAMASSTAVISTNSGGLPEVNINGKTGFLSDVGNIDKMANDTIRLLSDINMLKKFKLNALEHANSFALDNILPKYQEIYKGLCHKIKEK